MFVPKPWLRLPSASLAGKASVHFAGLWVRPCVLQLVLNRAGTEDGCICSYWSSHYYLCLWTGGKCRSLLAATLCPRCLHKQIFPQQKRGLVTGGSRCVRCIGKRVIKQWYFLLRLLLKEKESSSAQHPPQFSCKAQGKEYPQANTWWATSCVSYRSMLPLTNP